MKKVLFITYDFPFPTTSGGKTRAYNMLKYAGEDIDKRLASFVRADFKEVYKSEIEKIGVKIEALFPRRKVVNPLNLIGLIRNKSFLNSLYYSDDVMEKIIDIVRRGGIDVVHYESIYAAYFMNQKIKELGVKQIFGTENIEYDVYGNYSNDVNLLLKPFVKNEVKKIKDEETNMYKSADLCIAVSDYDADVIRKYGATCEVVRNGVDLDKFRFKPHKSVEKKLLFVGNFSYFPNIDAMQYFYKEVFGNLAIDTTLTVIGRGSTKLEFAKNKRIKCFEFVNDIEEVYHDYDIMIAPIRLGGGTNFKIIEAFAAGLPVVSLPDRIQGLNVKDNKHLLIGSDASEFAKKIELLFNDKDLYNDVAKEARALVEREYSWKIIGKKLGAIWEK